MIVNQSFKGRFQYLFLPRFAGKANPSSLFKQFIFQLGILNESKKKKSRLFFFIYIHSMSKKEFSYLIELPIAYKMAHSIIFTSGQRTTKIVKTKKSTFESGALWSIVMLIRYDCPAIHRKSSFHRVL